MSNFDRYSPFKANGKIGMVPFIQIKHKNSDKYVKFDKRSMRLDKLSYEYYNDSDFGWLIMQANPEYGSIENFIPDGVVLRIPFPLEETLNVYLNDIITYKEINGYGE
jgi:hypothetical protein